MRKEIKIVDCVCDVCGHQWESKVETSFCPSCKSPDWDKNGAKKGKMCFGFKEKSGDVDTGFRLALYQRGIDDFVVADGVTLYFGLTYEKASSAVGTILMKHAEIDGKLITK